MKSPRLTVISMLLLVGSALATGCAWWDGRVVRSQSPDEDSPETAKLVGDLAVPFGMFPIRVEGISLVTGLDGTGADPAPSAQRQILLGQMRRRDVKSAGAVLASPSTALVIVQGVLKPGVQKGERFDLEVRVPERSETSSLRGGWLLETDLTELAILNNQIRSGHKLGKAGGPLMATPSMEGGQEDRVMQTRARVLGGGVALKSRPLGLVLKPECQSAFNSARVERAVNQRFHSTYKGQRAGMATAKTDEYIELGVHPRYRHNIDRYVRVVRALSLRESEMTRQRRLEPLERQLLDPITSARAAIRLEGLGDSGVEVLLKGLESSDSEVRFRSAEALAYLDRSEAAEYLAEAARNEPAFRVFALTALTTLNDLAATEQLRGLLSGSSAETRYGAFRALTSMTRLDPIVEGEVLGKAFRYHVLDTPGTPMIHLTRSRRPEIVMFGGDQQLQTPLTVDAGNRILVNGTKPNEIAICRFVVGKMDQRRVVSNQVDAVIRAIVELGGSYPDVVQALCEAKQCGALTGRLEFDALPEAGRTYDRVAADRSDSKPKDPANQPDRAANQPDRVANHEAGLPDHELCRSPAFQSERLAISRKSE